MENAVKALLIAAGIFFLIMILSLVVYFYNQASTFYQAEHERVVIEQTQKFNAQFENYHREKVRGSDIISLMNKIIDYNASQSYQDGTNYERIRFSVKLGGNDILAQLKYKNDGKTGYNVTSLNRHLLDKEQIDNTTAGGTNWSNDRELINITGTSRDLIEIAAQQPLKIEITDTQLQQLASNISNLIIKETDTELQSSIGNRFFRQAMIEDLLGIKIDIDEITGKTLLSSDDEKIKAIQEIASQYYQYMQFKRAYFDCTEVLYDSETNRVEEMNFELRTELVNGTETIVFD